MTVRVVTEEPAVPVVGRALVIPGARYHAGFHGLYWPLRTLVNSGWRVTRAEWDGGEWGDDPDGFISGLAQRLADQAPDAPRTIVIGKSIGSRACGWAADRALPGIWLTPLLHLPQVTRALARAPRSLLAGGTADESWVPDSVNRRQHLLVEVAGMDHGMFVGNDWRDSFAGMAAILTALEAFLAEQRD